MEARAYATKDGTSFARSFAGALLAAVVFMVVALWAVNECELAWALRQEVRARLSARERDTLQAERLLCPTSYRFESQGRRLHAFIVDGWRGTQVFIGED